MRKILVYGLLILALIAVPLFTACGGGDGGGPETLLVGSLSQLTDWFATWDIQNDRELRVMADMINDKGGLTVDGVNYEIEIVTEDGESTLEGTTTAAEKLVYDDGVEFVVCTTGFFLLGAIPIFTQEKVINVMNCMTMVPGELSENTTYTIAGHCCIAGYYGASVKSLQTYFPSVDKIIYVQPDDGSYAFFGGIIADVNADAGFTEVHHILFPTDMVDFTPVAVEINNYPEAEAVIGVGIPDNLAPILKALRESGNGMPFVFQGAFNSDDIISMAGSAAATNFTTLAVLPGDSSNPPLINELNDEVVALYGPSPLVVNYPACLHLIVNTIEAAQSFDPDDFVAEFESHTTIDTIYGTGYVGGLETFGIKHYVTHPAPTQLVVNATVVDYEWVYIGPLP